MSKTRLMFRGLASGLGLLLLTGLWPTESLAIPAFARKYDLSCVACHAAFPRLNAFGEQFVDNNYRLPNWKDGTVTGGDDMMALPKSVPLALRAQAYTQYRDARAIDVDTGEEVSANTYFYGIFAEKGGNGEVIIEDAWFSYDNLFDTDIGLMLGQYQVSDLMFPRETRMTFQDFMVYRMAGLTYDRGLQFGTARTTTASTAPATSGRITCSTTTTARPSTAASASISP